MYTSVASQKSKAPEKHTGPIKTRRAVFVSEPGSKVEPLGLTSRVIAPYSRAAGI